MSAPHSHPGRPALGLVALTLGASFAAHAGDDQRGPRVAPLPLYQQECAACHLAYPPGLLPAESWRRLMGTLPRHYGTDASLDAETTKALASWLDATAGTSRRVREAPPEDRITKSGWFTRKHDEVPPATWKRASVKSAANCSACHTQADQGEFDEDTVRIPR